MIWDLLVGPVFKTISEVIKRVLPPEKMSEVERAQLEQTLQLAIMNQNWQGVEAEIQDRINARALATAELNKGNSVTNVLAALHRPAWSFVMLGLYVLIVAGGLFGLPKIVLGPTEADIMRTVIIFYFGGRSVEKVMSMVKGNGAAQVSGQEAGGGIVLVPTPVKKPVKPVPRPFTSESGFGRGEPENR